MNERQQGQADPKLALQYPGEVAQTYSDSLNPVEKAPFINQINVCMKVLNDDRAALVAQIASLQPAPDDGAAKGK